MATTQKSANIMGVEMLTFPELWSPITATCGMSMSLSTPHSRRPYISSIAGRTSRDTRRVSVESIVAGALAKRVELDNGDASNRRWYSNENEDAILGME